MSAPLATGTRRWATIGLVACGALVAVILGWGLLARIDSAVIAQGTLAPDEDATPVQHLAGGRIAEVFVGDGDAVAEGQSLVQLDTTQLEHERETAATELDLLRIRVARMDAQLTGSDLEVPLLAHDASEAVVVAAVATAQAQLGSWRAALDAQLVQVRRTPAPSRYLAAQEDATRASARLQVEAEKTAAVEQLALSEARLASLDSTIADSLVGAPADGVVFGTSGLLPGRVLGAGEAFMFISAEVEAFVVRARVQPSDIDAVRVDGVARVRFPGLNQRTSAELTGAVGYVSPQALTDPASGAAYFDVVVVIPPSELDRLPDGAELTPGMPAEALINTGERTALEWMLKPVIDQFAHALREE